MNNQTRSRLSCGVFFVLLLALICTLLPTSALAEEMTILTPGETVVVGEQGGMDNDALLDAYVQQMIDAPLSKPRLRGVSTAGAALTGVNKAIYDIMKERIGQIASGEAASTVIQINKEQLTDRVPNLPVGPWTRTDLGTAVVADGYVSTDAMAAAEKKMNLDFSAILNALLADCPYELYWFDKTEGCSYELFYASSYGGGEYSLYVNDTITLTMAVSSDYAASGSNTVESGRVLSASTAIQNAKSIVKASASTGDSVYNRLDGYRNSICEAVDYNDAAAGGSVPYGDPWQLIYVFDEDPETNVVCEGYSKAFKYLFDLSEFGGDYDCVLATGWMYDGAHMWNLVRMEDGNNYLVDVTNCDSGSIGAPDKLFMATMNSGTWDNYMCRVWHSQENYEDIAYAYDSETKNAFSQSALEISASPYTPLTSHTVDVSGVTDGTVTATPARAAAGARITLTVTPAEGYRLAQNGLRVTYVNNGSTKSVDLTQGTGVHTNEYSFDMPDADVTVAASFVPVFGTPDFTLPAGLKSIEANAFEGAAMTVAVIPNGCESIGAYAFKDCTKLTQIFIPASVTSIDRSAFSNCGQVYVYGASPSAAKTFCDGNVNCTFVEAVN